MRLDGWRRPRTKFGCHAIYEIAFARVFDSVGLCIPSAYQMEYRRETSWHGRFMTR